MLKQFIGLLLSFFGFILLLSLGITESKSAFQVAATFSIPSIIVGFTLMFG